MAKSISKSFQNEKDVLRALEGSPGIPQLIEDIEIPCDVTRNPTSVMERLNMNLDDLFLSCGKMFSELTVRLLAQQIISLPERVHKAGFVHGAVEPKHLAMGLGSRDDDVYLVGFGHCKRPGSRRDDVILPGRFCRWGSVWSPLRSDQSYQNDLLCVGYITLYWLRGSLPWGKKRRKMLSTTIDELFQGLSEEFRRYIGSYFAMVTPLSPIERPDYRQLKSLLSGSLSPQTVQSPVFDWSSVIDERQAAKKASGFLKLNV